MVIDNCIRARTAIDKGTAEGTRVRVAMFFLKLTIELLNNYSYFTFSFSCIQLPHPSLNFSSSFFPALTCSVCVLSFTTESSIPTLTTIIHSPHFPVTTTSLPAYMTTQATQQLFTSFTLVLLMSTRSKMECNSLLGTHLRIKSSTSVLQGGLYLRKR